VGKDAHGEWREVGKTARGGGGEKTKKRGVSTPLFII